jgi:hypothetical protein
VQNSSRHIHHHHVTIKTTAFNIFHMDFLVMMFGSNNSSKNSTSIYNSRAFGNVLIASNQQHTTQSYGFQGNVHGVSTLQQGLISMAPM